MVLNLLSPKIGTYGLEYWVGTHSEIKGWQYLWRTHTSCVGGDEELELLNDLRGLVTSMSIILKSTALAIIIVEQRRSFKSWQCDTHLEVKLEIEDNVVVKRGYGSLQ